MPTPSALPEELWKLVLQHVPLKDRLGSCSLVCTTFAAAAVAATECISIDLQFQEARQDGLMTWLDNYGQHVNKLKLSSAPSLTRLPGRLKVLKDLELRGGIVQLGAGGGQPGVLQGCAGVTRLELFQCALDDWADGLHGLSLLTNLHSLLVYQPTGEMQDPAEQIFPCTVLPSLVHLTHLGVGYDNMADLHHLSCLSKLCELQLSVSEPFRLTPSIAPQGGFSLPASLQSLQLDIGTESMVLDASLLQGLTGLRVLDVLGATFISESGGLSGTALLGVFSALQKLECLTLDHVTIDWPAVSPAYSALVASSMLSTFVLKDCSLPVGAYKHMFASGRVLPQLKALVMLEGDMCWDSAAVVNVASCCPSLQDLHGLVQRDVSLAPLQQLSGLTGILLNHRGGVHDGKAFMQGVAALTNLQNLQLNGKGGSRLGLEALIPLTTLRKLTLLQYSQKGEHGAADHTIWLACPAASGDAPDVWLRLLELLGRDSSCQPLLVRSLARQLAQQDTRAVEQQQVVAALQQQVAELQQDAALTALERAAARMVAAELRGQLQVLQGQLQQLLQQLGGRSR